MPSALKDSASLAEEIDMDRVVADPEYRRRIITRLRRERILKAQATADEDDEAWADDD